MLKIFLKKNKFIKIRGITLIELLLYISLVAVIVLSISSFFVLIQRDDVKNQVMTNVNDEGKTVIDIINRAIREAKGITTPAAGTSDNSLVLSMADPVKDPTIFSVDTNGILNMKEGASSPVAITDSRVKFIGGDSYTKLLLHMNGDNNGTAFTDSSSSANNITTVGAVTKIDQKKFGSASGYFDGASYLTAPTSDDFNFGEVDFTVDGWIRMNNLNGAQHIVGAGNQGDATWSLGIGNIWGGNAKIDFINLNSNTFDGYVSDDIPSLQINTWYHIAVVKFGNTLYEFLDGNLIKTFDVTGRNFNFSGSGLFVGARSYYGSPIENFNGYIDELRISKGIARWTSDFSSSLPSQEYQNSLFSTTPVGGDKNITYNFTVKSNTTNSGFEYNYSKDFSGGTTLRSTATLDNTTHVLTYIPGTGGTIVGSLVQVINSAFNGKEVTAVPITNYHFVKWTDTDLTNSNNNSTNPIRIDTNVTHDDIATANFAVNP